MVRSYKYRLYPTKQQSELLNKHFGCCRLVYNLGLEAKNMNYQGNKVNLSCYDLHKQITDLKKEYSWMFEVSNMTLQQSIIDLDRAFTNYFKGQSCTPKFKNKNGKQCFRISKDIGYDVSSSSLFIPKFREGIKAVFDRIPEGKINSCTISKTPTGKYFASLLVRDEINMPVKPSIDKYNSIGIDLGISTFAILSDGTKIENPKYFRNNITRIKVLQRRASRKIKDSQNRKKANLLVALKHEKIVNRRNDFIHKLTYQLVCKNQATTICIEDLAVSNMLKNHKLAQAISDASWSEFVRQLSYKCDWHGKNLVKVDRFYASSKTCSNCGTINKSLTLKDRMWTCDCGVTHDRDINAAINIRNSGVGCSGEPVELPSIDGALKQEMVNTSRINPSKELTDY